nr:ribonuclease H-like domain-containing protein [Tanacetum cinerariifolium]
MPCWTGPDHFGPVFWPKSVSVRSDFDRSGYCRFCDLCCYVHDANACLGTTNNGSNRDRRTSNNTINELLQKLLQQLEGMNVHTTVSPFTNTTSIPNVAFYTGSPNHSSPSVSPTYPPSFPAQTNSNYITGPYPSLPSHAPLAHLNPTGFVSPQVHTFVQPNGTHSQPAPHPVNLGHTTLSGQATNLPHAFNTETLQELSIGAWNIDTVGDGQSIPVTKTGHSILPTPTKSLHLNNVLITPHIVKNLIFVRDNSCTIEFDAFGFSVKDFLTRRVLLRWWMSFSKRPGKNTPQCYSKPLDSLKNWNNRFFWVDECVFRPAVEWRINTSKDGMPASSTYSVEAVRVLDTHRTPIQKQPEALLCLVEMDLFSLIRAPNPTKVKTGSRPRAPHELSLLTLTASRVIEMDEPSATTDSSGVPLAIEKSLLDFTDEAEASGQETAAPEVPPPEEVSISTVPGGDQAAPVAVEPPTVQESHKRGCEVIDANAPPKSLRRDHADLQPSGSSRGGKSLAAMQLCLAFNIFVYEGVPADVSDPDPLAFADAPSPHPADVIRSSQGIAAAGDPGSENVSFPTEVGSPGSVYRPEWGVTNGSLLDTPEACQDLVDHAAPLGYFSELRHMHNYDFLGQYNINLARQVAMGSQLRLRFEQEAKLLRKSVAQVARREQRIQARESEIKSLEALLETEVSGEETLKAAFKDYKRQQDQMVEQRHRRPQVRDPRNPWACTEEIKLADAIAANIIRAEQKKRSRIVCRTHGVGSAHHARFDRVPVSAPIVVPHGLALILVDAATQTDLDA